MTSSSTCNIAVYAYRAVYIYDCCIDNTLYQFGLYAPTYHV